jgi:hypothetical protein
MLFDVKWNDLETITFRQRSSFVSKTRFGRSLSNISMVIQKGTMNPNKNNSIQKAIPAIRRNKTIPKTLMAEFYLKVYVPKVIKYFITHQPPWKKTDFKESLYLRFAGNSRFESLIFHYI